MHFLKSAQKTNSPQMNCIMGQELLELHLVHANPRLCHFQLFYQTVLFLFHEIKQKVAHLFLFCLLGNYFKLAFVSISV